MTIYYAHLNLLDIDPIIGDKNKLMKNYQSLIDNNDLNPKLIDIMDNVGIKIPRAESFYSKPFYLQQIHTDNLGGDYIKLNYVYSGFNSTMSWYSVKDSQHKLDIRYTPDLHTEFIHFKYHDVELVDRVKIGARSTLVQVGCPHSITNGNEYRLCVSLILIDKNTGARLSMSDAVNRLSQYIGQIGAP
jgi:hypothetical protein